MPNNPPTLGTIVSNTDPALLPGPNPLTGQHVTLERLTPHHIPDLYEHLGSHDAIWTYLPDGPFRTPSAFADWLTPHLEKSAADLVIYAILLPPEPNSKGEGESKAVGIASLFSAHLTHRVIELGLLFSPHALQRTTAATEVLFLIGCLVFEKLNYRRLEWKCDALNLASRRAAERYGFVYEGTARQERIVKGRNRDSCWYSMVDGDWWGVEKGVLGEWLEEGNFGEGGRQRRVVGEVREGLR